MAKVISREDWLACVGAGWHKIVGPLVDYALEHGIEIRQIKEKFGGLRFYCDRSDETLRTMVDAAEAECWKTCEACGDPGILRTGGWLRTLCDKHVTPE